MTAKNQRIAITAGDSRVVRFVCSDPNGAPVDLTGAVPVMWIADTLYAAPEERHLEKTGTMDQIMVGGQAYWCALFDFADYDTVEMVPQTYMHQCEVRTQTGKKYTVAEGPFVVGPSLG